MAKGFWAGVFFTLAAGGAAAMAYKLFKENEKEDCTCVCDCDCVCNEAETAAESEETDEIDTSEIFHPEEETEEQFEECEENADPATEE